ncbi:MAG: TonB-dependent receptor plug domain-containing protein, partial [Bacteroidia bacterium]|nr:TonB-dependent receptor plug domain-containing protein [Bacteroidia bacterium]
TIKPLTPGEYTVRASFVGKQPAQVNGVIVSIDKITYQDIKLKSGNVDMTQVNITSYAIPLIEKGSASVQTTVTSEEIEAAPVRNVTSLVSTAAGVYQADEGDEVNVRGGRTNSTDYYIDGIKVRGSKNLPQSSIEQITTITGGIPASYGDATSGIISITTKGPSQEFFGGVEFVTSELFDNYGYNLGSLTLSGPISTKKTDKGTNTILGYFLSAEYQNEDEPDAPAIDQYVVKSSVLDQLEDEPLRNNPLGFGTLENAEFLTFDDLEKTDVRLNVGRENIRFSGKLDFAPVENINFTLGGSLDREDAHNYTRSYAMLNSQNNLQQIDTDWRIFGKFTQKFGAGEASEDGGGQKLKNAFYSIQFDYSKSQRIEQDDSHEDRIFDYGSIGTFTQYRTAVYAPIIDNYGYLIGQQLAGFADSAYTFTESNANLTTQNFTSQYYALQGDDEPVNAVQVSGNGGILNGQRPSPVYAMWYNTGRQQNLYRETDNDQYRLTAMGSADIKNHAIQIGFEYEQRKDRRYGIAPIGLYGLMRLLANQNNGNNSNTFDLTQADTTFLPNGTFQIDYPLLYTSDGTPGFYENFRDQVGVAYNEYLDSDSYDRSLYSLDLFTPDELLNDGNAYVAYYGYDAYGNKSDANPSLQDFFTKKDANGNLTREIAAFEPIYMAGYIQDQFAFNDLIFNVGVRIDRFDANQSVLKDPYSLYATTTAGELTITDRPANIGDGYVVYVSDINNPSATNIIGYRDGDIWYDASGNVLSDPIQLAQSTTNGTIAPYLVNPDDDILSDDFVAANSFEDYTPEVIVNPRIAFSFPISDEAVFFAHYDKLSQRPPSRLRFRPLDYLYLTDGGIKQNPNLQPERTTEYELGFKQTLSKSSAFSISAFYRELRDMIQVTQVQYAHPGDYVTYDNIDYGTVKGLAFSYDLRRTQNVRLTANYTLQFADGTGSGDQGGLELVNTGQPNLRTLTPLDFDQRHTIVTSIDYRYEDGSAYNGPMWFGKQFFANTGLNIVLRAGSGTPYSAQSNVTTEANDIGLQTIGTTNLKGNINGSRLPWQYRVDARLDRD